MESKKLDTELSNRIVDPSNEKSKAESLKEQRNKTRLNGDFLNIQPQKLGPVYKWFGKNVQFGFSLRHIMLLAFTFGYIDGMGYYNYRTYPAMMTGNMINICIYAGYASGLQNSDSSQMEYSQYIVKRNCFVIFMNCTLGPVFCMELLRRFKNRENVYFFITISLYLSLMAVSLLHHFYDSAKDSNFNSQGVRCNSFLLVIQDDENCIIKDSNLVQSLLTFVLGILSLFCGSLVHWTLKIGYVTNFITFNMMRITESTYKYFMNIYQGGNKLRGDLIIFFTAVLFFILGALCAIYLLLLVARDHLYVTTSFCALTCPLHLYFGYYKPRQERIKLENKKATADVMKRKSILNPVNSLNLDPTKPRSLSIAMKV